MPDTTGSIKPCQGLLCQRIVPHFYGNSITEKQVRFPDLLEEKKKCIAGLYASLSVHFSILTSPFLFMDHYKKIKKEKLPLILLKGCVLVDLAPHQCLVLLKTVHKIPPPDD